MEITDNAGDRNFWVIGIFLYEGQGWKFSGISEFSWLYRAEQEV